MSVIAPRGFCAWFTGLPSAGKSTLARRLEAELRRRGCRVEVLDGDEVRQCLTKGLGFSREDRDENIRRIAYVAQRLVRNGVVAITAVVSPYRAAREAARRDIEGFVEIYVRCALDACIQRDVKGLYRRALAGEIEHFTGISDPYEEPLSPELVIDSDSQGPDHCLAGILARLTELGHLAGAASGTTPVLLPTYLVDEIRRHPDGQATRDVSTYVLEAISRRLAEEREGALALTAAEREVVEARLRQLGYIA